VEEQQRENDS